MLTRPFWIGLACLMLATPLGLLAAGTAWGEWAVEDFKDPEIRQEIVAVSLNNDLPQGVPSGLEQLATVWSAPLPDYAPEFLKNPSLGYLFSAMVGCGLVILACLLLGNHWLGYAFSKVLARMRWRAKPEVPLS